MEVGSKGGKVEDEDDEDDEEARRCDASLFRVKMEEVEFGDDEKEKLLLLVVELKQKMEK
jgi:hypothetical protein